METAEKIERHGTMMQILHWGIALLVLAQLTLGKFAEVEPQETGESFFPLHASLGLLLLGLMLARIFWRLTRKMPAPFPLPGKQQMVMRLMHGAFYVVLLLLPISGWKVASMLGEPIRFFGVIDVPRLPVALGEELAKGCKERHELLGNVLLVLFAVHTLATLKHHFVDRDGLLRRMLPY